MAAQGPQYARSAKAQDRGHPAAKPKGPMLDFLFRRLTAEPKRGAELFDSVTNLARRPHWYVEGEVPDSLDGRFAALATILAIVLVRLEADGEAGDLASVALTERFIEVMESEHRELGIGDPTLGKTVRKLVGSLARRTDLWRSATAGEFDWGAAVRASLYKTDVSDDALSHSGNSLKRFWAGLQGRPLNEIGEGKLK
ncbi:MAG TPA: ubiquinol-cytochrome C chaperone family protein [Sphingomicrobium sp.]|jgi:cytochrome b pre-mRNA-processing protein 3|nr:ubiquinol-cytochrome C chaperone family protein [Sphingomicrobium sp.]